MPEVLEGAEEDGIAKHRQAARRFLRWKLPQHFNSPPVGHRACLPCSLNSFGSPTNPITMGPKGLLDRREIDLRLTLGNLSKLRRPSVACSRMRRAASQWLRHAAQHENMASAIAFLHETRRRTTQNSACPRHGHVSTMWLYKSLVDDAKSL